MYVTQSKPVYIELAASKKVSTVSTKICAVQNGCNGLLQKKKCKNSFYPGNNCKCYLIHYFMFNFTIILQSNLYTFQEYSFSITFEIL